MCHPVGVAELFDRLTVWEHFRFVAATYRLRDWEDRARTLLARLELDEKRDVPSSDLSRGMRQKLALGCGWLHHPRAVLLDEPFTGPDPREMAHSDLIVVWGGNPVNTQVNVMTHIAKARNWS